MLYLGEMYVDKTCLSWVGCKWTSHVVVGRGVREQDML